MLTSRYLQVHPSLLLYSDGGTDRRLTYLLVQMSLIALFLKLDLNFLCVARLISLMEKSSRTHYVDSEH